MGFSSRAAIASLIIELASSPSRNSSTSSLESILDSGVSVGSGVGVGVGIGVAADSGVGVGVGIGVAADSGVGVGVGIGIAAGSGVGIGMAVGVEEGEGEAVGLGTAVAVGFGGLGWVVVLGLGGRVGGSGDAQAAAHSRKSAAAKRRGPRFGLSTKVFISVALPTTLVYICCATNGRLAAREGECASSWPRQHQGLQPCLAAPLP